MNAYELGYFMAKQGGYDNRLPELLNKGPDISTMSPSDLFELERQAKHLRSRARLSEALRSALLVGGIGGVEGSTLGAMERGSGGAPIGAGLGILGGGIAGFATPYVGNWIGAKPAANQVQAQTLLNAIRARRGE